MVCYDVSAIRHCLIDTKRKKVTPMKNTNMNTNTATATATANHVLADLIANVQNGYVRDRKHEKVAVWELKQAIIDNFGSDNHAPIVIAFGNWMVCAGYSVMNRSDVELYAIVDRVIAFCVNGTHITVNNKNHNARADVFSSGRVKAACYRAITCDYKMNVRKEEEKPSVKVSANNGKVTKKEARIVRIMEKFGCDRATAEEMAV